MDHQPPRRSGRRTSDPDHRRRPRGCLPADGENIFKIAVVALSPNVPIGFCVDQLNGDADAIAGLSHASLQHVFDPEFARDVLHLYRLALVHEGRVARDDEQVAETRQLCDDVLGEAVREKLLLWIAAHVDEGQDSNGRLLGVGCCQRGVVRFAGPGFWFLLKPDSKDMDRTGNVLDDLLTEILKQDVVQAIAYLITHGTGDTDPARLGEHFQAGRHVNPVAKDVISLDDHISQIDPDTELYPPGRRDVCVASCHAPLYLGRAQHRVGDAMEFHQHTVAAGFDDAAPVSRDGRINELNPMGLETREGPRLVRLHEPTVADHISGDDGREPALWSGNVHVSAVPSWKRLADERF